MLQRSSAMNLTIVVDLCVKIGKMMMTRTRYRESCTDSPRPDKHPDPTDFSFDFHFHSRSLRLLLESVFILGPNPINSLFALSSLIILTSISTLLLDFSASAFGVCNPVFCSSIVLHSKGLKSSIKWTLFYY